MDIPNQLGYQFKSILNLQLDYHNYNLDSLQEYAYKPSLVSKLDFCYDIGDKILSSVELIKFNRSISDSSVSSVSLNNIVDQF